MPDLRERFRDLDSLDVPDVMGRANDLGPKTPGNFGPTPARRVTIAAFALLIALVPIVGTMRLIDPAPPHTPARPGDECRWKQTAYDLPDLGGNASLVTGTSLDDLWIVEGRARHSSLLHFDGMRWSQIDAPTSQIKEISALAPNDLWLLGTHGVFRYDGARWTRSDFPAGRYFPSALDVESSDDAWVVGSIANTDRGPSLPTILHWDGDAWSESYRGGTDPSDWRIHPYFLEAVSAWSPTDVWAVGSALIGPPDRGDLRPAIMHWDGTEWSIVPMPDRRPGRQYQHSAEDVIATGPSEAIVATSGGVFIREGNHWTDTHFHDRDRYGWMLAQGTSGLWALTNSLRGNELSRWNGTAWRQERVGEPGKHNPWAYGIAAIGDAAVVVGGSYYSGDLPPTAVRFDC